MNRDRRSRLDRTRVRLTRGERRRPTCAGSRRSSSLRSDHKRQGALGYAWGNPNHPGGGMARRLLKLGPSVLLKRGKDLVITHRRAGALSETGITGQISGLARQDHATRRGL
jgi:hypothetical protein